MANCQGHGTHPSGHNTSEVVWGGHDSNPNHMNESLLSEVDLGAHDSFIYISNTTTILHGQQRSWETTQIRCDQLKDHMAPVKLYVAGTKASRPAVLYPRKARNRLDESLRTMFSHLLKYKN